jgi:hypothetical protein
MSLAHNRNINAIVIGTSTILGWPDYSRWARMGADPGVPASGPTPGMPCPDLSQPAPLCGCQADRWGQAGLRAPVTCRTISTGEQVGLTMGASLNERLVCHVRRVVTVVILGDGRHSTTQLCGGRRPRSVINDAHGEAWSVLRSGCEPTSNRGLAWVPLPLTRTSKVVAQRRWQRGSFSCRP